MTGYSGSSADQCRSVESLSSVVRFSRSIAYCCFQARSHEQRSLNRFPAGVWHTFSANLESAKARAGSPSMMAVLATCRCRQARTWRRIRVPRSAPQRGHSAAERKRARQTGHTMRPPQRRAVLPESSLPLPVSPHCDGQPPIRSALATWSLPAGLPHA